MTTKEIVKELVESYSAGDTGIYHNDWFMIRISPELKKELEFRSTNKEEYEKMLDTYYSIKGHLLSMGIIE